MIAEKQLVRRLGKALSDYHEQEHLRNLEEANDADRTWSVYMNLLRVHKAWVKYMDAKEELELQIERTNYNE